MCTKDREFSSRDRVRHRARLGHRVTFMVLVRVSLRDMLRLRDGIRYSCGNSEHTDCV